MSIKNRLYLSILHVKVFTRTCKSLSAKTALERERIKCVFSRNIGGHMKSQPSLTVVLFANKNSVFFIIQGNKVK